MILQISLDLNSPTHDYKPLYDYLKSHKGWMHYIKAAWFIDTTTSPQEVFDAIGKLVDKKEFGGDFFTVTRLNTYPVAWMPRDGVDWLTKHNLPKP